MGICRDMMGTIYRDMMGICGICSDVGSGILVVM